MDEKLYYFYDTEVDETLNIGDRVYLKALKSYGEKAEEVDNYIVTNDKFGNLVKLLHGEKFKVIGGLMGGIPLGVQILENSKKSLPYNCENPLTYSSLINLNFPVMFGKEIITLEKIE